MTMEDTITGGAAPHSPTQAEYWSGPAGLRWVTYQERLDRAFEPFARAVLDAAALTPGERVLDVGCGCGSTTLQAAALVGAGGRVTGIDLSVPMLERAAERARDRGMDLARFELINADAGRHRFATAFDVVLSRFGVMFFDHPAAALNHLGAAALRPDGRLAFICWRRLEENPWMMVPLTAVHQAFGLPAPELAAPPSGPGPFAFSHRGRVERLLRAAGFADVDVRPFDAVVTLSTGGLDQAVELSAHIGPAGRLLAEAAPEARVAGRQAVAAALGKHARAACGEGSDEGAVELPGATWIVTAGWPGRSRAAG
jgi:SAM-dependent methyltransferase